ncbi:hypothetical protein QKQ66_gp043 [Dione juno nucleopolyhedrovirus]|uniref:Uncharacterized protein n=1 Tax=Dione juno nucleopolyhedrovirus TaxID=2594175 RepID=A0AAE6H2P2_9ABAC|nr:hypothetical protein QKQ66_gp043 [Dione juno nucleopolyhedrovirus]QDL56949.1 hypothetical protein DijuNPV-ORF-43 [Dione juno nucleopolyhedrovirus]
MSDMLTSENCVTATLAFDNRVYWQQRRNTFIATTVHSYTDRCTRAHANKFIFKSVVTTAVVKYKSASQVGRRRHCTQ